MIFSVLVQPVCLPALPNVEDRLASVVGYGRTEISSKWLVIAHSSQIFFISAKSDIPLSIDVRILSSEQCEERFYQVSSMQRLSNLLRIIFSPELSGC